MEATTKFVVLCWVVFAIVWLVSALRVKPTKERQPLSARLVYLALTLLAAMLLNGGVWKIRLARPVLRHTLWTTVLADVIVLVGLMIAVWARVVLAGNWSARVTLKENHELIRRGPYRVVRHPRSA